MVALQHDRPIGGFVAVERAARNAFEDGVYVDWRDGFWVAVNYSSRPAQLSLPPAAEILMGSNPLKPADVLVWK